MTNVIPNPTYEFCFVAEATETEDELLIFLKRVAAKARELGFHAKVFSTVCDNRRFRPQVLLYTQCLLHVEHPALKGIKAIRAADATDFDSARGTCGLWPRKNLLLLLSGTEGDRENGNTCFGFMQWPEVIRDSHGRPVVATGVDGKWVFINQLSSPDPRYREIVRMFGEAGYLNYVKDGFNQPPPEPLQALRCPTCGADISKVLAGHAGRSRSEAKAEAARRNGRLGGRPRKAAKPEETSSGTGHGTKVVAPTAVTPVEQRVV